MAERTLKDVVKNRGRLVINPTDLSIAHPHGGLDLGMIKSVAIVPGIQYRPIVDEAFGQKIVDQIVVDDTIAIAATLRGFTDTAKETMFPSTAKGATTGARVVRGSEDQFPAGSRLSDRAVKLLFSPDDPNKHDAAILYFALPMIDEAAELQLDISDEMDLAAVFLAVPDANGNTHEIGRIKDLSIV